MISKSVIDQIKQIPLVRYLEKEGFFPCKSWEHCVRFNSPLRIDQHPSFDVDTRKNVWVDRGLGEGGDIIQFVKRYRDSSFREAVAELSDLLSIFSFRPLSTVTTSQAHGIRNLMLSPVKSHALIQYLASRAIDYSTAKLYLQEANYVSGPKHKAYYALAWKNKLGGYELRNKYFKGCTGNKSYTFVRTADRSHHQIFLFEGMMDFLSLLSINNQTEPDYHSLILNSTTLLNNELISKLRAFKVHTYFDNDLAGSQATKLLQSSMVKVVDHHHEYARHKDLNEFLVSRK